MQLELSQIRKDGGTQPRASYHFGIAESYAEDMAAGAAFPPVVVFYDGADYWLADGFHRVFAAEKIEQASIEAEVRQGTLEDAQWYSYSVNQSHGLRRDPGDKKRAVEAALQHSYHAGKSDQEIADHVGVTREYVGQISRHLGNSSKIDRPTTRTVTRKGKMYQQNTSNIGKKKQSPTPKPAPESEDDEPLTDYEEQIAAQYQQNGVTAPISEPAGVGEDRLIQIANDLIAKLNYEDFRRLVEIMAERIAVDV